LRNLEEWLDYQQRAYPQAIELGLTRLNRVLARLHWLPPQVPVITIAGTNGKGSVAALTAAMLHAAGLRAGVFTSPHLRDYRERIRVDLAPVDSKSVTDAFERIEAARGEIGLTFFEYNTLAALLIFGAAKLDAWILEVGLGGRLDAVNSVDPDVAVVVSIGLDHQEYLGTTLESIGAEKAGIFRAQRPAILGRSVPPNVAHIARQVGAKLKRLDVEYGYTRLEPGWCYCGPQWLLPDLPPPGLPGEIQFENAATAIAILEELSPRLKVSKESVAQGLAGVHLPGRFQIIRPANTNLPTWILDVAHNPAAAQVLAVNLRARKSAADRTAGRTLAVCGILIDKDAESIVGELRDEFDAWWFGGTDGPRGSSGEDLRSRVTPHIHVPAVATDDIAGACRAALEAATGRDTIVVFGSFHSVGPALDWLAAKGLVDPKDL
jgi:dihydrofolate synthase / folylpolyglutamate synthase